MLSWPKHEEKVSPAGRGECFEVSVWPGLHVVLPEHPRRDFASHLVLLRMTLQAQPKTILQAGVNSCNAGRQLLGSK